MRVAYVFVAPVMMALAVYLILFLGLNSRRGSERVASLISSALTGEMEYASVVVGPSLQRIELFDARIRDLEGHVVVRLAHTRCDWSPSGLVDLRIRFSSCEGRDGELLILEDASGDFGFIRAFRGPVRPKRRGVNHPHILFEQITLDDIDVIIALDDMMLRMDNVDVENGRIESGRVPTDMRADATWAGGRLMMSERMFSMGDGKRSWADTLFESERRVRPRWAVQAPVPLDENGRAAWLDVPLSSGAIRDFVWYGDNFRFGAIDLNAPSAGARFEASGWLRLLPERPPVAPREEAGVMFDGRMVASLAPDSTILEFVLPGVVRPTKDAEDGHQGLEPLVFDGAGDLRFYRGADTRIRANDVEIVGVPVRELDLGVGWDSGRVILRPDSHIALADGRVTGSGWLRPRDGVWSLGLCIDDVNLSRLLARYIDPDDDATLRWLAANVQTSPARCVADEDPGVLLGGRLTRKGLFELAPGATTPEDATLPEPPLHVSADGLRLRWPDDPPLPARRVEFDLDLQLDLRGRVQPRPGVTEGLRVVAGGSTLGWSGGIDLVENTLLPGRLRASVPRLERWLRSFGITAPETALSVELAAEVSGPLSAPQPRDVRLRVSHPEADDMAPDFSLEAAIDVVDDAMIVTGGRLQSSLGRATIDGRVGMFSGSIFDLRPDPSLDLALDLVDIRVGAFVRSLGPGALLETSLDLSGRPSDPRVAGERILLLDASLGTETFEIIQTGAWRFDDDGLAVEDIRVNRGKGNASGRLTWDARTQALEIDATGRGFQLRELRTVAESGIDARGEAQFDLRVRGAVAPSDEMPVADIEGSIVLDDLVVDRVRVGGVALTFDTWDDTMHVAGAVAGDLDVDARVPLSADGTLGFADAPVEGRVRTRGMRIEDHWSDAGRVLDRSSLTGVLDVTWDPATGAASADLTVEEATARIEDREFGTARPLLARWLMDESGDWRVELDDVALGSGDRVVTIGGRFHSGDVPSLSLTAGGEVDVSLLRFVPDLITDADGVAAIGLKVNGPLNAPVLSGRADHGRVRIVPRGLGTSIDLEPGWFALSTEAITFDRAAPLRGTLFGGEFTAFGEIGLEGLVPASVDLSALVTQLGYRIPEQLNTTLTGQIRFIAESLADYDTWSIAGDIELVDARFYRDFDVVADQFAFGSVGRSVDQFALPIWMREPAIGRMQADLTVTGRDRFFVESRVANVEMDVEMRTDLTVGGRLESMEVRGEMEALDGSRVTYRGRTFEVEEARLLFRGERDAFGYPIPWLDAELTASIRPCVRRQRDTFDLTDTGVTGNDTEDVFVTAWVEGPLPYELTFRLESTPFYDQRDQLSLILTGCTVDELTAASAGAPTLDLVLRPVVELVERNVEERLDFDDVDLTPTTEGTAGIVIQDEVTERFTWTLDATVGTGEQSRQIVRGEYRVFDWLILEVQEQTSPEENIQIDTGIRFRFTLD